MNNEGCINLDPCQCPPSSNSGSLHSKIAYSTANLRSSDSCSVLLLYAVFCVFLGYRHVGGFRTSQAAWKGGHNSSRNTKGNASPQRTMSREAMNQAYASPLA